MPRFGSTFFVFGVQRTSYMLTELNEALNRLKQEKSQRPQKVETLDTSRDEKDTSKGPRKILSRETIRIKKLFGETELSRFFVTGPSDAANMPSHFHCPVCRKNVSELTQGHHEVLQQFQGSRHFAHDQRLRLETPGWRKLYFHQNPLSEDELERQRWKIRKGRFVVRDCEQSFAEDLIADGAGVTRSGQFSQNCLVWWMR